MSILQNFFITKIYTHKKGAPELTPMAFKMLSLDISIPNSYKLFLHFFSLLFFLFFVSIHFSTLKLEDYFFPKLSYEGSSKTKSNQVFL